MRGMKETYPISYHPPLSVQESALYREATSLVRFLRSKGHVVLFAGGAVRDMVLQNELQDIDIATDATTRELLSFFPKAIQVGVQFGVIRVLQKGHEFEIATFRTEEAYEDGRHPSIVHESRSYQEDAQRRDFTINGLFFDPLEDQIFDCVGGLLDIQNKLIRTIGRAEERFSEDKLRVVRAIRFSHVLSFPIHDDTKKAMVDFAPLVPRFVSGERIWDEFSKMEKKNVFREAILSMYEIGLWDALFPFGMKKEELIRRVQLFKELPTKPLSLFFAALLYDQKDLSLYVKEHFRLSNSDTLAISNFQILLHGFSKKVDDRSFVKFLSLEYSCEALCYIAYLLSPDPVAWYELILQKREELLPWIEQQKSHKYVIRGKDLFEHGITPGKEMGALLEEAFALSIQRRELDKEVLLSLLLQRREFS